SAAARDSFAIIKTRADAPPASALAWRTPMSKRNDNAIARRNFLKGATLASAAALAPPTAANALPSAPKANLKAAVPGPRQMAVETQPVEGSGESELERRRLHGRRVPDARHRLPLDELRIELPRPARSRRQSRQQHQA